jgi:hypothetical protein
VRVELDGAGGRFRDIYQRVSSGEGPSESELRDAFSTIAGAWDQVSETFTTAMSDPDLRMQLRRALSSLATAVGNTLTELGDELSHAVPAEGEEEE